MIEDSLMSSFEVGVVAQPAIFWLVQGTGDVVSHRSIGGGGLYQEEKVGGIKSRRDPGIQNSVIMADAVAVATLV